MHIYSMSLVISSRVLNVGALCESESWFKFRCCFGKLAMAALSNSASQPIAATNRAMRCSGNMDGVVGASQPGDSPRSSAPQDFERCSDLREWLSSHGGQRPRRKSDDAYAVGMAWRSKVTKMLFSSLSSQSKDAS